MCYKWSDPEYNYFTDHDCLGGCFPVGDCPCPCHTDPMYGVELIEEAKPRDWADIAGTFAITVGMLVLILTICMAHAKGAAW